MCSATSADRLRRRAVISYRKRPVQLVDELEDQRRVFSRGDRVVAIRCSQPSWPSAGRGVRATSTTGIWVSRTRVGARDCRRRAWLPQGAAELSSRSASAAWRPGPLRCAVAVEGFSIPVDEPESAGGTGLAPQPTDLFLASVASCFALALAHSARKLAIALDSVRVDAVGDYIGFRFDAVHLIFDVVGPSPEELTALVAAAERVCYVTNTLRTAPKITVTDGSAGRPVA
jgi:uncharacterized OsmC-like protein